MNARKIKDATIASKFPVVQIKNIGCDSVKKIIIATRFFFSFGAIKEHMKNTNEN